MPDGAQETKQSIKEVIFPPFVRKEDTLFPVICVSCWITPRKLAVN